MQYNIKLPSDYDMNIIKKRIEENGYKTDGFNDLICKVYLFSEKGINNIIQNSYEPLYIWKASEGMNEFIFNGYFDNVLNSFGWTNINIGITYDVSFKQEFQNSKYIIEEHINITPQELLKGIKFKDRFKVILDNLGEVIIYNPDKWMAIKFTFVNKINQTISDNIRILNIGHIST